MFEEDKNLSKVISRALFKAIKAFYKEIERAGYDGAYFGLKIQIAEYSSDFEDILEVLSWDNLGSSVVRHEILRIAKTVPNMEVER